MWESKRECVRDRCKERGPRAETRAISIVKIWEKCVKSREFGAGCKRVGVRAMPVWAPLMAHGITINHTKMQGGLECGMGSCTANQNQTGRISIRI